MRSPLSVAMRDATATAHEGAERPTFVAELGDRVADLIAGTPSHSVVSPPG